MERPRLDQGPAKPLADPVVTGTSMEQTNAPILTDSLQRAFAQPVGQALPREFLAMLVALDRAKQGR
jgi:hypothetical protein